MTETATLAGGCFWVEADCKCKATELLRLRSAETGVAMREPPTRTGAQITITTQV